MSCPSEDSLLDFLEQRMDGVSTRRIQEHLDGCPACRGLVAEVVRGQIEPTEEGTSQSASPFLLRGAAVGRYTILSRLGEGGMGVVYAAYDPELDRRVALKLLRPEAAHAADASVRRDRLVREARVLAGLSHPNLVTVHDIGSYQGQVFIAMELVSGETVGHWLRRAPRGWLPVLEVFLQAGRGLAAAHAAGVVHRDFKPDNVLLDASGRVRVGDFGLARSERAPSDDGIQAPSPPESGETLTRTGMVVGTPAYMAPEQLASGVTDARSDQFSFCVALFEGLYGRRPFAGADAATFRGNLLAGKLAAPPPASRVPARLARILARGLSVDPVGRYPSLEVLLADLQRDPAKRRKRQLAALVVLVALGGAVATAFAIKGPESLVCKGAERKLDGIWDDGRRAEVERAFLATGRPFSASVAGAVARVLGTYTAAWVAAHTEACEAARLRGEQSEATLELRLRCLGRRLHDVSALTAVFARADAAVVERAPEAAHSLRSIADCADVERLAAIVRPPADPAARARVDALEAALSEPRALREAARYGEARRRLEPLLAEARSIGYRPLEAEALFLLGLVENDVAAYEAARRTLVDAVWAAEAGRHDKLAALASTQLAYVVGYRKSQIEAGREWAGHARAVADRMGPDDEVEAGVAQALGTIAWGAGKLREAARHFRRSLAASQRVIGAEHPAVARALHNLGFLATARGRHAEAVQYAERAVRLRERLLGPRHPLVATSLDVLGGGLRKMDRLEEALAVARRALEIREKALAKDHPDVALALTNLGRRLFARGAREEGAAHCQRALDLWTKRRAAPHRIQAMAHECLSEAFRLRGDARRALAEGRAALALRERLQGREHPELGSSLMEIGRALFDLGAYEEARAVGERNLALRDKALGRNHPWTVPLLAWLSEIEGKLGKTREALAHSERALAIAERRPHDASSLARAKFALAQALAAVDKLSERALRLAVEARELWRQTRAAKSLARVSRWLADRGR